jgi:hypothetical protein
MAFVVYHAQSRDVGSSGRLIAFISALSTYGKSPAEVDREVTLRCAFRKLKVFTDVHSASATLVGGLFAEAVATHQ